MNFILWIKRQTRRIIPMNSRRVLQAKRNAPFNQRERMVCFAGAAHTLGCAKVVLSSRPICHGFVPQLPRNASTSPFSPDSGEKEADRPDEGAFRDGRVRENPPHPALSPKSFAAMLRRPVGCSHANDSGERGHYRTVRTAQIQDKEDLTKSNAFAQPRGRE